MRMIQKQPLTGRHKRPSEVRLFKRFAKVEVFGDDLPHIVDPDIAEDVAQYRWSMNGAGYATTWISGHTIYLHGLSMALLLTVWNSTTSTETSATAADQIFERSQATSTITTVLREGDHNSKAFIGTKANGSGWHRSKLIIATVTSATSVTKKTPPALTTKPPSNTMALTLSPT